MISHPRHPSREECATAIVGLVKAQHERGIPFRFVTITMESAPEWMAEKLRPWVHEAYCENSTYFGDDSADEYD